MRSAYGRIVQARGLSVAMDAAINPVTPWKPWNWLAQDFLRAPLAVLAMLAAWQVASRWLLNPYYISRPSDVVVQIVDWIATGYLWPHLQATLLTTCVGFVAASVAGLGLALVFGSIDILNRIFGPFIYLAYTMPKIVLAPMLILWFGVGWLPPLVMAFITGFFMVFFNCYTGIRAASPALLDAVVLMGASPFTVAMKVRLPAALPYIAVGLHQGLIYAFHGCIVGEMTASNLGMGYLIVFAAHEMNATGVIAGLTVISAIAFGLLHLITSGLAAWGDARQMA